MSDMTPPATQRVLLEMRPALDGFAGIPQETRLLFRGLCLLPTVTVQGLLQTSLRFLPPGLPTLRSGLLSEKPTAAAADEEVRLNHYSRFILSLEHTLSKKRIDALSRYVKRREAVVKQTLSTLLMPGRRIATTFFESKFFETVVWQTLFAKTLAAEDFLLVTARDFRVCTVPWNVMQSVGLASLRFLSKVRYPRLRTEGVDVFISQTPYPARVDEGTALVVRYHDALPVFMSPAFANKARHQATHFHALTFNERNGAYFACVSESTRQDLLKIFPALGRRAVTIHNMVSSHFFVEPTSSAKVRQIVRNRVGAQSAWARPDFKSLDEQNGFYAHHLGLSPAPGQPTGAPLRFLLMVATLEPRKNHLQLLAAWHTVRAENDTALKLVLVGSPGWDMAPILAEMRPWIDQGQLFMLSGVPAADLRVLYRHAEATVCPSLAEGFDFSGVEALCSGSIPIASDIAVHREVYAEAAEYFQVDQVDSLVRAIQRVLYDASAPQHRRALRDQAAALAQRYQPEAILPQWDLFLKQIAHDRAASLATRGPTHD